MAKLKYRSLLLTLVFLTLTGFTVDAQRTLGVQWDVPQNNEQALEQLQAFKNLGVSVLEIEPPVSNAIWQKIDELDFSVYGTLQIQFPVADTFQNPDSLLIKTIREYSASFIAQPSVTAIELFSYGAIHQEKFRVAIQPIVQEIKNASSKEVYVTLSYQQALPNQLSQIDFVIRNFRVTPEQLTNGMTVNTNSIITGYRYAPVPALYNKISPFKQFIDATTDTPDKTIFLDSRWLLSMVENHTSFKSTIQGISTQSNPPFPVPNESLPTPSQSSVPIIALLVLWASVALHYNTSPLYRKSLFRYFSAHNFFISDIFKRHIRSAAPATILIFQNALLIGALIFASTSTLMSSLGLEAFVYHFEIANYVGKNPFELAIWGFTTSLVIALISIFWLYLSHKKVNSLTQISTIYAWPLHINLLVGTIAIVLFAAQGKGTFVAILTLLALLIQILSFIITAFDAAPFMRSSSLLYLFLTNGIYILLVVGLLVWAFSATHFRDVLSLALRL